MNVLIIGSNPSQRSVGINAFCPSTKYRQILNKWLEGLDVIIDFDNVSHYPTPGNRPLRISEIREAIPGLKQRLTRYNKIIAVGKTAAKALDIAGIEHFKAPHPSGLNRFWNDKERAAKMIESIRDYVRSER